MLKENLVMLRNMHGFSQEEIAEKIDISRQAYAKWESGATVPDIEKCKRLADIYGVMIDSLIKTETIDGKESIPPAPNGRNIWGSVTINERGQLVIPKAAREKFGLTGGQRLIVLSDDKEGIALVPAEMFEERMKKQWSGHLSNQRNNRPRLLTTGKCVGGEEPFYASISIASPDLNFTVKRSAKTVIFSMSFLTRASSNSLMSVSCPAMKSCSSLIRFMASSR